jgi:hypothetical protein
MRASSSGPVLREHGATERIDLALPGDGTEASALKAEFQSSDAGEKGADGDWTGGAHNGQRVGAKNGCMQG